MTALVALCSVLFSLWLLSLKLRDASIIDLFWGPAFSVVYWLTVTFPLTPRALVVGVLVSTWGLRLGAYLAWRNLGHGEDKRYQAMRARNGSAWWWRSLFVVFLLQGALAFLVSWPVRSVAVATFDGWSVFDVVGGALVVAGLTFESVGDLQLARFKSKPEHKGQLMTTGLWRYTRHPNYFGDALVWWGFGVFALSVGAWWSLVGPLVMNVLLVKVSGKDLLERGMRGREGFEAYTQTTSGFLPWPPKQR